MKNKQEIEHRDTMPSGEQRALLDALPAEFGLAELPDRKFRVDRWSCYFSREEQELQVVFDVWCEERGGWLYFRRDDYSVVARKARPMMEATS